MGTNRKLEMKSLHDRARVQVGFVPIFHFRIPRARSLLSLTVLVTSL